MIELEILVEVKSAYHVALKELNKFKFISEDYVEDVYYYDPLRKDLLPNNNRLYSSFRLRKKGNNFYVTYKNDIFLGDKWLYSNEQEVQISNFDTMKEILDKLGLKPLVSIENKKKIFNYNDYEIVLEKVDNLGVFLEVEIKREIEESQIFKEKRKIQEFINSLNLEVSEELNSGKPELLLKKYGFNNKDL